MKLAANIADREAPIDRLAFGVALSNVGIDASAKVKVMRQLPLTVTA